MNVLNVVHWYFLFFLRGLALSGPYNSQEECLAALKTEISRPVMDQGFDRAVPSGICFQGAQPKLKD